MSMKLAVVGGGSTYTPELVDGFARLRDVLPVEELVLVDPAADRLELRRRSRPRGSSPAQGHPGTVDHDDRPGRRRSTAPTRCCSSCGSAARRPGTRTRPGRWSAAASGRRPPAPAVWPRRCARSRSSSTSPSGCAAAAPTRGSSTSPTRSASSPAPCSRRATGRSGCATSRSASSAASPGCSAWRPTGSSSTTSGSTT